MLTVNYPAKDAEKEFLVFNYGTAKLNFYGRIKLGVFKTVLAPSYDEMDV